MNKEKALQEMEAMIKGLPDVSTKTEIALKHLIEDTVRKCMKIVEEA